MASSQVRARLYEYMRSRLGQYVPQEHHPRLCTEWFQKDKFPKGIHIEVTPANDPKRHSAMKAYFLRNFYMHAPIPLAIRMPGDSKDPDVQAFLDKEMSMYLESGNSLAILDADGSIVGAAMNTVWKRDDRFELFEGATGTDWQNVAAQIAMEERPDRPQIIWRDYQFQHLYHTCQHLLRICEQNYGFLCATFFCDQSIRALGVVDSVTKRYLMTSDDDKELIYTQSNFRKTDARLNSWTMNKVLFDKVAYKDLILSIGNERLFKPMDHLGEARFFANIGEENLKKLHSSYCHG